MFVPFATVTATEPFVRINMSPATKFVVVIVRSEAPSTVTNDFDGVIELEEIVQVSGTPKVSLLMVAVPELVSESPVPDVAIVEVPSTFVLETHATVLDTLKVEAPMEYRFKSLEPLERPLVMAVKLPVIAVANRVVALVNVLGTEVYDIIGSLVVLLAESYVVCQILLFL